MSPVRTAQEPRTVSATLPDLTASTLVHHLDRTFRVTLDRVPGGAWLEVADVDLVYARNAPRLPLDPTGRLNGTPTYPLTADYLVVAGIALARLIPQEVDQ